MTSWEKAIKVTTIVKKTIMRFWLKSWPKDLVLHQNQRLDDGTHASWWSWTKSVRKTFMCYLFGRHGKLGSHDIYVSTSNSVHILSPLSASYWFMPLTSNWNETINLKRPCITQASKRERERVFPLFTTRFLVHLARWVMYHYCYVEWHE